MRRRVLTGVWAENPTVRTYVLEYGSPLYMIGGYQRETQILIAAIKSGAWSELVWEDEEEPRREG